MKQAQDIRAAWEMLYAARTRHPVLVVRAVAQLLRARAKANVCRWSEQLTSELWGAIKHAGCAEKPGQLTPEEITRIGRAYRDMLRPTHREDITG